MPLVILQPHRYASNPLAVYEAHVQVKWFYNDDQSESRLADRKHNSVRVCRDFPPARGKLGEPTFCKNEMQIRVNARV